MNDKKQCTRCKRWLPLTSFHKHKPSKDGRKPRCKDCRCELQRSYNKEHPEEKRERDRKYYYENIEERRAKSRQYQIDHKEEKRVRDAQYRAENPERLKVYFREYYRKNRKRKIKLAKQYAKQNKEKIRQYQKEYKEKNASRLRDQRRQRQVKNSEQYRIYRLNYIARKNNAEGEYSPEQWETLCRFFSNICPCCNKKIKTFQVDHIIPLTWDNTSNWITNIQPLCKRCNTAKGNHHATDYRPEYIKRWAERQKEVEHDPL